MPGEVSTIRRTDPTPCGAIGAGVPVFTVQADVDRGDRDGGNSRTGRGAAGLRPIKGDCTRLYLS